MPSAALRPRSNRNVDARTGEVSVAVGGPIVQLVLAGEVSVSHVGNAAIVIDEGLAVAWLHKSVDSQLIAVGITIIAEHVDSGSAVLRQPDCIIVSGRCGAINIQHTIVCAA